MEWYIANEKHILKEHLLILEMLVKCLLLKGG